MEKKLKHLEFIQQAINRMASNLFLLKGWTVTLIAAMFALEGPSHRDMYEGTESVQQLERQRSVFGAAASP